MPPGFGFWVLERIKNFCSHPDFPAPFPLTLSLSLGEREQPSLLHFLLNQHSSIQPQVCD